MKPAGKATHAAFWDTSAIVPLCCFQKTSVNARHLDRTFKQRIVWWATSVEATGALQRVVREESLSSKNAAQYYLRLEQLRNHWIEVEPTNEVRDQAERLLRMHKLRADDALQLAAALSWCNNMPRNRAFIAGDGNLLHAAQIEGFSVFSL